MKTLPVGKLPPDLLAQMLAQAPQADPDVIVGPQLGYDCAVVAVGDRYLVLKSDPITFATTQLGWYLVQVNVNDLATTGATPRWMLITLLLPEGKSDYAMVEELSGQIYDACRQLGIAVVGGHTEVTYGLDRPLAVGTLIGEVSHDRMVTPGGMKPGDRLILTKGAPIEATAILANELAEMLEGVLTAPELDRAANYLYEPGISVLRDAQTALAAGEVSAMHDPTEGGIAAALWELAAASDCTLVIELEAIEVPELSAKICTALNINPYAAIASGALLLAVPERSLQPVLGALHAQSIAASVIGIVEAGPVGVWTLTEQGRQPLPRPERDEVARIFEERVA